MYLGYRDKRSDLWMWIVLLALATAGLMVTISAPGNSVRAGRHGTGGQPLRRSA